MANPNYSNLDLHAIYGQGPSTEDGQTTNIYKAISHDSDEIDHKFVYAVTPAGRYIELAHYTSVKQVVIQNISGAGANGIVFYVDNTTGALVPNWVIPGQHISFCDPDVTTGILLFSFDPDELVDWHLAFCGRKD